MICVVTFNGEYDLLDLHYNCVKDYIDRFIVIEFDRTFTGKEKPLYGAKVKWGNYPKAEYRIHQESLYSKYKEMAQQSPNTIGAAHWKMEFMQKESIKDALDDVDSEADLIIGDVDEIWDGAINSPTPLKLKLKVYAYYLDNRSSEEFWGPISTKWGTIKDKCLNHVRSNSMKTQYPFGWHFTSMGGYKEVKRKLDDSYTEESYNTQEVQTHLKPRLENGIDYLGRAFEFRHDEESWPPYLKANRTKYAHLCKSTAANLINPKSRYEKRGAYGP